MAWKHSVSFWALKSPSDGRRHIWSFSALLCRRSEASWDSFSRTSDSKTLLGWLELSFARGSFWEPGKRRGVCEGASTLRFLMELGDEGIFCRELVESPRTRFWGSLVMDEMSADMVSAGPRTPRMDGLI